MNGVILAAIIVPGAVSLGWGAIGLAAFLRVYRQVRIAPPQKQDGGEKA